MPTAKNMKDLQRLINKEYLPSAMKKVAKTAKNIQQEKVFTEVYDKYTPSSPDGEPYVHKRRGVNGGLADQRNMKENYKSTVNRGVELSIENITKGAQDNFDIAALVEYGDNAGYGEYAYKENRDGTADHYLRARPFTAETMKELENGRAIADLRKGLSEQGLDVK